MLLLLSLLCCPTAKCDTRNVDPKRPTLCTAEQQGGIRYMRRNANCGNRTDLFARLLVTLLSIVNDDRYLPLLSGNHDTDTVTDCDQER